MHFSCFFFIKQKNRQMALICQNRPVPWRGLTEKLGKLEARVIQRCIQVDTYVRGVCSRVCDARRPRGLKSFGFGLVAAALRRVPPTSNMVSYLCSDYSCSVLSRVA